MSTREKRGFLLQPPLHSTECLTRCPQALRKLLSSRMPYGTYVVIRMQSSLTLCLRYLLLRYHLYYDAHRIQGKPIHEQRGS